MKKIIIILILATFILLAQPVLAADLGPILPPCAANGRCSLCDLIQVGVNFGEFLFAISGALLLLFIFYGGFLMLVSGGNPQTVGKGKSAMVNAVIGILIVFTAYMGVNFIIAAVTSNWSWSGNLKCAPLPESVGWTAGIIGQGAGGTGTGGGGGTTPAPQGGTGPAPQAPNLPPTDIACSDAGICADTSQYCNKQKMCQPKKGLGGICSDVGEFFGHGANMCLSTVCDTVRQWCIGAKETVELGGFCTSSEQCKPGPSAIYKESCNYHPCIKASPEAQAGQCSKKLLKDVICEGLNLGLGNDGDDIICFSGLCGGLFTNKCSGGGPCTGLPE